MGTMDGERSKARAEWQGSNRPEGGIGLRLRQALCDHRGDTDSGIATHRRLTFSRRFVDVRGNEFARQSGDRIGFYPLHANAKGTPPKCVNQMKSHESIPVDVCSFLKIVLSELNARPRARAYRFRGMKSIDYPAEPSVFRRSVWHKMQAETLSELVATQPSEFHDDDSTFDQLVRAQHHGLPTRLMDVCTNPLFALYFATADASNEEKKKDATVLVYKFDSQERKFFDSDTVSVLANLSRLTEKERISLWERFANLIASNFTEKEAIAHTQKVFDFLKSEDAINQFNKEKDTDRSGIAALSRLIQFVRQEKPFFERRVTPADLVRVVPVQPKLNNKRIIAQNGSFFIYGLQNFPKARGHFNAGELKESRIRIPRANVDKIRSELMQLSVDEQSLFPELETVANILKNCY